jgi:hypothetical protein
MAIKQSLQVAIKNANIPSKNLVTPSTVPPFFQTPGRAKESGGISTGEEK